MNIQTVILSFLFLLVINCLYNLYYFLLAKSYYSKYKKHIKNGDWFIIENRQNIKKLFLKAGIKDSFVSNVEPLGYGMIQTANVSVFSNMAVLRDDIAKIINGNFREAISIYKNRAINSFNPIYWLEFIVFLPKHLLLYLGIGFDSLIIRILQLLYWLIGFFAAVISIFFNYQLIDWIKTL